jgi:hypothetical protein
MRFYVCDIKTGDVIDEYPMEVTSELSVRLKTYGTGELALLTRHEACPTTWREDFVPWRILVLVCDDDDRIIWGGVPNKRATTHEDRAVFPMVTLEKYLDRRYMPSAEFAQEDQTAVIARTIAEVCGDPVIGVGLSYDMPPSGVLRDRSYFNDEDARVLTRLQQLSNVKNGFEWTIALSWEDEDHARVIKTLRTGYPTLGYTTTTPELEFSVVAGVPGPITEFSHEAQWGEGEAATFVQAVGDGEGEDKPYSLPVIDADREAAGWPRLEERKTWQGVTEASTLEQYVQGMRATYFGGQSVISFAATTSQWPTPADVALGDSVRVEIDMPQLRLSQVWRLIGYSISPGEQTWTPVIARIGENEDEEEDDDAS